MCSSDLRRQGRRQQRLGPRQQVGWLGQFGPRWPRQLERLELQAEGRPRHLGVRLAIGLGIERRLDEPLEGRWREFARSNPHLARGEGENSHVTETDFLSVE